VRASHFHPRAISMVSVSPPGASSIVSDVGTARAPAHSDRR
jgi:hypothetical protein